MSRKVIKFFELLLCFSLIFEQSGFAQVAAELDISGHILQLHNSLIQDKFRPLHLRYLSYNPQANNFRLLLDKGDLKNLQTQELESSTKTLLNYFFIGITLSNDSFWVNLRPDSENQIIDDALAKTDVGKILLEADLQLKKDTAKFTSPETPEGKEYWEKLYQKAGELFGPSNITIPTLTRPWIVPDEIIIREAQENAYIYKATLKVMLEQDYLKGSSVYNFNDERLKTLNEYSSQFIREKIIPKLTKEINTSKRYASLRQVYYSLILAQWFKQRFYGKGGLYSWLIDKQNLNGLISKTPWSKITYFKEYQKSFKEGEYNIKTPVYTIVGQTIRSYMSGGIAFMDTKPAIELGGAVTAGARDITRIPNRFLSSPISIQGGSVEEPSNIRVVIGKVSSAAGPSTKLGASSPLAESSSALLPAEKVRSNSFFLDRIRNYFNRLRLYLAWKQVAGGYNYNSNSSRGPSIYNTGIVALSVPAIVLTLPFSAQAIDAHVRINNPMSEKELKEIAFNALNKPIAKVSIAELVSQSGYPVSLGGRRIQLQAFGQDGGLAIFELNKQRDKVMVYSGVRLDKVRESAPWVVDIILSDGMLLWVRSDDRILTLILIDKSEMDKLWHHILNNIAHVESVYEFTNGGKWIELGGVKYHFDIKISVPGKEDYLLLRKEGSLSTQYFPLSSLMSPPAAKITDSTTGQTHLIYISYKGPASTIHFIPLSQVNKLIEEFLNRKLEQRLATQIPLDKLRQAPTRGFKQRVSGQEFILHYRINQDGIIELELTDSQGGRYVFRDDEIEDGYAKVKTRFNNYYILYDKEGNIIFVPEIKELESNNKRQDTGSTTNQNQEVVLSSLRASAELVEAEHAEGVESARSRMKGVQSGQGSSPINDKGPVKDVYYPTSDKGGIDFRSIPIVTQPMEILKGQFPKNNHPIVLSETVPLSMNLDAEWQEIQNMLNAGIIPSIERIKEYLQVCFQKEGFSQEIDKMLACLADILRLEEERVLSTDSAFKELLVLLESDKSAQEMQFALSNITVLPKEPRLIEQ